MTSRKLGTPCNTGKMAGMTWYQRTIWTSSGMLRNSSVHALPSNTRPRFGVVRRMPISEPNTSATARLSSETEMVHPHAESIQSR